MKTKLKFRLGRGVSWILDGARAYWKTALCMESVSTPPMGTRANEDVICCFVAVCG